MSALWFVLWRLLQLVAMTATRCAKESGNRPIAATQELPIAPENDPGLHVACQAPDAGPLTLRFIAHRPRPPRVPWTSLVVADVAGDGPSAVPEAPPTRPRSGRSPSSTVACPSFRAR